MNNMRVLVKDRIPAMGLYDKWINVKRIALCVDIVVSLSLIGLVIWGSPVWTKVALCICLLNFMGYDIKEFRGKK